MGDSVKRCGCGCDLTVPTPCPVPVGGNDEAGAVDGALGVRVVLCSSGLLVAASDEFAGLFVTEDEADEAATVSSFDGDILVFLLGGGTRDDDDEAAEPPALVVIVTFFLRGI